MTRCRGVLLLDPAVLAGKPVIRGTRLSVDFIIGLMADGWSEAHILENYPASPTTMLQHVAYARDVLEIRKGLSERRLRCAFSRTNFPGGAVTALQEHGHDVI